MYVEMRDVRCQAAAVLGKRGDPRGTTTLIALCSDKDRLVRQEAVLALGALGRAAGDLTPLVVEQLMAVCQKTREVTYVRIAAISALGMVGEINQEVIGTLISLCQDSDEEVRHSARQTLGQWGHAWEELANTLYQHLEKGRGDDRDWLGLAAAGAALRIKEVTAWVREQGGLDSL